MNKHSFYALLLSVAVCVSGHADIVYAPRQKVIQGDRDVACIGVSFKNKAGVSASKCSSMGRQTAEFYRKNSRGLLNLKSKGYSLKMDCNHSGACYNQAVNKARAQHPGQDIWMITGHPNFSHAGSKTAYLMGSLYRDSQHEVGHLLGLGHAGAYIDGKLEAYKDGGSVMGKFPSAFLTAPQYYSKGWLFEKEAAMYQPDQENIFELKPSFDFASKEDLKLIIVKNEYFKPNAASAAMDVVPEDDDVDAEEASPKASDKKAPQPRNAYISWPSKCEGKEGCLALHLAIANGGGTQRIKIFGNEFYDERFTGLHIKRLGFENGKIKVQVDFQPKPSGFKN